MSVSLQREVEQETKRQQQAQANLMQSYESRIAELSAALSRSARIPAPTHNLYGDTNANPEQYDVFISHASEDKESFVNEFADELQKRGVKVWIDALSIGWGDSLRSKIDSGLKNSRFGIVVISRNYIRKGWTNYELDGLFEKEMNAGKTILPIWHDISKKEVQDFSPALAGRKAMTTGNMTAGEIADELARLLPNRKPPTDDTSEMGPSESHLSVGPGDEDRDERRS